MTAAGAGAALAALWLGLRLLGLLRGPPRRQAPAYFDGPRPLVIAHRGASAHQIENTLPAFRDAVAAGADVLELDVWLSADGHPVVIHDPTLERTMEAEGRVSRRSRAELARLGVPALAEVFEAWPGIRMNVDIKDPDPRAVEVVMELARPRGERTLLASFHPHVQDRLAEAWAPLPRSADYREVVRLVLLCWIGLGDLWRPRTDALQIPPRYGRHRVATRGLIQAAHRHGVPVHVWTLDFPEDWARYRAWGVDGIMTNDPAALRAWLEATR